RDYSKSFPQARRLVMRPTERLLDELNRAFGGEAWHGPALRNLLDNVNETQAKQRPIANAHSILELVVHIGTWMDVVARRIAGSAVESTTVEDWSDVTRKSWPAAIEELEHAESRLSDAVARLNDAVMDEKAHREVMGALQHNVYHSGQIALLRKALGI